MKYTLPDEREKLERINRRFKAACIFSMAALIVIDISIVVLLTLTRIK